MVSIFTMPVFATDWPPISDADRSMTSIPEQPGAPAVILLREQTDDNMNNVLIVYERIKILTEAGRACGTVELPESRLFNIAELKGRTVHADGSVLPFTGKATDKPGTSPDPNQVSTKIFTLPDVQVGSIIDFRYTLRYTDFRIFPPEWEVQSDLFQRKAYFKFIPLQNRGFVSVRLHTGQLANNLAWTPFLAEGPMPEIRTLPAQTHATVHDVLLWVDLTRNDIPPVVQEPFMPSASLLKWRVYFYYQTTLKPDDYWKDEGKFWNKGVENYLEKNDGVMAAVARVISPTDGAEQKLRKLYSFVSALKNENDNPNLAKDKGYPLEYRSAECITQSGVAPLALSDAAGCVQDQTSPVDQKKQRSGVRDVLSRGGGTHNELNRLFVAMVRSAGIPASLIWATDRTRSVFVKDYLSTDQLDGEVAVVQLDGKDVFLDPGSKFCPYGLIDWRYSSGMGLRQSAKGVDLGETPALDYKQSLITRKADLTLDHDGVLTGVVSVVFKGVPAMVRRKAGDLADSEARRKMPAGEVGAALQKGDLELLNAPDWNGRETPLVAQFRVRVPLSLSESGQLLLAQHLFESKGDARFPASQRVNPVDFRFPWQEADEVHIALAKGMEVQGLNPDDDLALGYARYRVQQKQDAPDKLYARRDFIMTAGLLQPDKYKEVKNFFDTIKSDDDRTTAVRLTSNAVASH